jgi:hypothetical protein
MWFIALKMSENVKFFVLQKQVRQKYKLFLVVGNNISIFVTNRQWHKLFRVSVEFFFLQEKINYLELNLSWANWSTRNPTLSSSQALAFAI